MAGVLVFDPGDSTGWVYKKSGPDGQLVGEGNGEVVGGTFYKNFETLEMLFNKYQPDVVVYEVFKLYAGAAKHLIHDEFYTVQVIGAIKMLCIQYEVQEVVPQGASVKRFSGGLDARWKKVSKLGGVTEHVKDAYLHLRFYERFAGKQKP